MKLDRKKRITLVCTIVWLIIIFIFAAVGESEPDMGGFELNVFLGVFFLFGVLPVVIAWGIIWIIDAPSKRKKG